MTVVNPPLFLNVDSFYSGDDLGLPFRDLIAEGVIGPLDLIVSQRLAGANMSVDVLAGGAWVKGDTDAAAQPTYRARSSATVNLAVAAADATNPRVDRVILEVRDATFTGSALDSRLRVVTGTPTGGATLSNLSGAAAVPVSSLLLADVLVPASSSSVTNANIADRRPRAFVGGAGNPLGTAAGLAVSAASVYRNTTQSITHNTLTAVQFDTELVDTDSMIDIAGANTRVTIVSPGLYIARGRRAFAPNGTGARTAAIRLNGSTDLSVAVEPVPNGTFNDYGELSVPVRAFSRGDYLELTVFQTSGAGLNTVAGVSGPMLSLHRVG